MRYTVSIYHYKTKSIAYVMDTQIGEPVEYFTTTIHKDAWMSRAEAVAARLNRKERPCVTTTTEQ